MRGLVAAVALLALPLAGCVSPGVGAGPGDVPAACAPDDAPDPYPQDELFAERSARVENDTLRIRACLVNGQDVAHRASCQSGPTVRVQVQNATSGELVFARPATDIAFAHYCREETLPANAEWPPGRLEVVWDLRKDICAADDDCGRQDHRTEEGERVPAGDYVVEIRYVRLAPPWNRTVALPGPS